MVSEEIPELHFGIMTSGMLLSLFMVGVLGIGLRPAKPRGLVTYFVGNPIDSQQVPVGGPAVILMGGGPEVDSAFQKQVYPVVNGGDIVVLRRDERDGYQDYLFNMSVPAHLKPNSVETLVVKTRDHANSAYVDYVVSRAELVFMAGGDQVGYLENWKNTALNQAILKAYGRGAVVGGLSAGCAVMGEFIYDPENEEGVVTSDAVADPYNPKIEIAPSFLDLPLMSRVITDTHFYQRDRMGRLVAFIARLEQDKQVQKINGMGLDEETSMFITSDGIGRVLGKGSVYVIRSDAASTRKQVVPGEPLIYSNLKETRLSSGSLYHISSGITHGGRTQRISVDGTDPSNPYGDSYPY